MSFLFGLGWDHYEDRVTDRHPSPLFGIDVKFTKELPSSSSVMVMGGGYPLAREFIEAWSETALLLIVQGVLWHDDADHCPTWTDAAGCRCDVEEVA